MKPFAVLATVAATVAVAGCTPDGRDDANHGTSPSAVERLWVELPTSGWEPGDPGRSALITGVVAGSATVDGGCVWLEGSGGQRHPVLWPKGFTANFHPVTILGPEGVVVARAGQQLRAAGAYAAPHPGSKCLLGSDMVGIMQAMPRAR